MSATRKRREVIVSRDARERHASIPALLSPKQARNSDRKEVLMPAIYPSAALKNRQREIKAIADREPVYITESGAGKYVFLSEAVLETTIAEAVEKALYEARVDQALAKSREDCREGRFYSTRDDLMAAIERKRAQHATA